MKTTRPDWVSAVGVIAIIFAVFGLLGGVQSMVTPRILAFQRNLFDDLDVSGEEFLSELEKSAGGEGPPHLFFSMFGGMFRYLHRLLNPPAWYAAWLVWGGALKILTSGFYLLAALLLLNLKPPSIPLFYAAGSARILLGIAERMLALRAMALPGMLMLFSGFAAIGVVVDIVLLVVVIAGDKSAFIEISTSRT
jgi:cellulose synthase/poly-beta-1,6-N-acetylglucosamine synthase-like glycosyltransferase